MGLEASVGDEAFTALPEDGIGVFDAVVYRERKLCKVRTGRLSATEATKWLHEKVRV